MQMTTHTRNHYSENLLDFYTPVVPLSGLLIINRCLNPLEDEESLQRGLVALPPLS